LDKPRFYCASSCGASVVLAILGRWLRVFWNAQSAKAAEPRRAITLSRDLARYEGEPKRIPWSIVCIA